MQNTENSTAPQGAFESREYSKSHMRCLLGYFPENSFMELRAFSEAHKGGFAGSFWLNKNAPDFDGAVAWAEQMNANGCGVFVSQNSRSEQKGTKESVKFVNAVYCDADTYKVGSTVEALIAYAQSDECLLKPSMIVFSGQGAQIIYLFEPTDNKALWLDCQEGIAQAFRQFGSDRAVVTDTARVLRLTPTINHKPGVERETFVAWATPDSTRYTLETVDAAYGDLGRKAIADRSKPQVSIETGLVRLPGTLPDEIPDGDVEGEGRNVVLFKFGCSLRGQGFEDEEIEIALTIANGRCEPPKSDEEVEKIIKQVCKYPKGDRRSTYVFQGAESETELTKPATSAVIGKRGKDMLKTNFVLPDFIIHGLARAQVGQIVAKPNVGKTKLLRNLALCLAAGKPYLHLTAGGKRHRVAYFDMEDQEGIAARDIRKMAEELDDYEREQIAENLLYFVDEEISGQALSLSKPTHLAAVRRELDKFKPDFIIVDTMAAAFEYTNENDNSEMTQKVMKPMKELATLYDAAVLIAHHSGKRGENGVTDTSNVYSGRGASSVAGFVRAMYCLDVVVDGNQKHIRLSAPKIKGRHLPEMNLANDTSGDSRWFMQPNEVTALPTEAGEWQKVVSALMEAIRNSDEKKISRKAGIVLSGVSERTFDKHVESAVKAGWLVKEDAGKGKPVFFSLPESLANNLNANSNVVGIETRRQNTPSAYAVAA